MKVSSTKGNFRLLSASQVELIENLKEEKRKEENIK